MKHGGVGRVARKLSFKVGTKVLQQYFPLWLPLGGEARRFELFAVLRRNSARNSWVMNLSIIHKLVLLTLSSAFLYLQAVRRRVGELGGGFG
jgi:hypothetical protein